MTFNVFKNKRLYATRFPVSSMMDVLQCARVVLYGDLFWQTTVIMKNGFRLVSTQTDEIHTNETHPSTA